MAIIPRKRSDGTTAYRVVVHTPQQGHVTIGTFDRKKDASLAEAEYKRTSLLEDVVFIPKKVPFIDLSQEFLNTRRVKPQTLKAYSTRRAHMVDYFGNRPVTSITRSDCELFLTRLNDTLSARTANVTFKVFRQVMQYAVDCGYVKHNPSLGVKLNTVRQGKDLTIMSPQDHQKLVEATSEPFRTLVYMLPFTGLRMGEAIGLRWEDVDLFGKKIHVAQQKLKSGGFAETKTHTSERTVNLPTHTIPALRKWKLACPSKELVFPAAHGGVMSFSYFYENVIYPLREVEGFEGITTHDFRHTFVSWLIACGADIKYIQDQCGHASASVTLDTYGHLFTTDTHAYIDRVGDWYVTASLPQDAAPQVRGTEG